MQMLDCNNDVLAQGLICTDVY